MAHNLAGLKHPPKSVILQSHWDVPDEAISSAVKQIRTIFPQANVLFMDWYAPADIRHPGILMDVDLYVKKQVLADMASYERGFIDTNLVEYECSYNDSYVTEFRPGIDASILKEKLYVGWNFAVAGRLVNLLQKGMHMNCTRPIEFHYRVPGSGKNGSWYDNMRRRCHQSVEMAKTGRSIVSTDRIPYREYIRELSRALMCFSPFGYGEVCWRDFEAIACGAALIKQDMSHIQTNPNVYQAYETYLPVEWDMSNLEDQIAWLKASPEEAKAIARNAVEVWSTYLKEGFTQQCEDILGVARNDYFNASLYSV